MSQPAYAKLERPDARPRTATLRKVAKAMGLSLEQLTD
jgi:DNA-binding phage protein